MKYLIENLLLYRDQHGFVPKKVVWQTYWKPWISQGGSNQSDTILFFSEEFVDWVKDYLSFRKQRGVMTEAHSDWVEVSRGRHHGLGNAHICILHQPYRINKKIKLNADDSKILAVIKDWEDAMRL